MDHRASRIRGCGSDLQAAWHGGCWIPWFSHLSWVHLEGLRLGLHCKMKVIPGGSCWLCTQGCLASGGKADIPVLASQPLLCPSILPTSWESPRGVIRERQGGLTGAGICQGHEPQLQHPPLGLSKHLTDFLKDSQPQRRDRLCIDPAPSVDGHKPAQPWPEPCRQRGLISGMERSWAGLQLP